MRSDLNSRSSELICWLTADWVTPLIWAALVKLCVSARSQKTFKLSICISGLNLKSGRASTQVLLEFFEGKFAPSSGKGRHLFNNRLAGGRRGGHGLAPGFGHGASKRNLPLPCFRLTFPHVQAR